MSKIKVRFFQRKPKNGANFSLEFIFNDIRDRLKTEIESDIRISSMINSGFFTIIFNVVEAFFRQSDTINHITGETNFLNLLMKKQKVVLTILDCGPLFRKKGISKELVKWLYLKLPIAKATLVTAISEVVKNEIISYAKCSPDKIKVIPVAVSSDYFPSSKKFNHNKPIILQIGTAPNKNLLRLFEALEGLQCHLMIVGKLNQEQISILENLNIDYSTFYNLSQEEMLQKYIDCDIVSFISTFEGFGMPIIEANCVERVVISSNISSMPEIANDAACLVDPYNIDSIKAGLTKLINDSSYRNTLIENGKKNRQRFDADIIAKQYLEIYQEIDRDK